MFEKLYIDGEKREQVLVKTQWGTANFIVDFESMKLQRVDSRESKTHNLVHRPEFKPVDLPNKHAH